MFCYPRRILISQRLLVTGAAGHLGRRVVEILLEKSVDHIVATTRNPSKLADLAARGVEVRVADSDKPETLASAFAGVDRLLLISTDAMHVAGQRLSQHRAAVAAAEKAGVKHIVYKSLPAPQPSGDNPVETDHFWTELAIATSSMSWIFMRHAIYADTLTWQLPQALAAGKLVSATGNQGRHFVTREDCARADAAALASTDAADRIYEVTGPAAVTFDEIAAIASELTGKPLVHVAVDEDKLRAGLAAAGAPPVMINIMTGFDVATARGFQSTVSPVVQDLTGREPTSVREYLVANKAALDGVAEH